MKSSNECPNCGCKEWTLLFITPGDDQLVLYPHEEMCLVDEEGPPLFDIILVDECENCGIVISGY